MKYFLFFSAKTKTHDRLAVEGVKQHRLLPGGENNVRQNYHKRHRSGIDRGANCYQRSIQTSGDQAGADAGNENGRRKKEWAE